ncbi:hypothetical protein CN187_23805 [Sinorhizobium meliloti]|uniref:hypothetical protein n=1 Tax=Rhizobium meliloti TaxID=382 RepID=UPI000FD7B4C6|nr:hypothetical protein [Sinorhizobium meliloti]RVI63898.1 hypothetical protein CN187_23805 [Sinorhizobium meliloti]
MHYSSSKSIKEYLILIATIAGLSACNVTTQTGDDADKVINGARNLCGFAPTAASILSLLNVPGAPTAEIVVKKICTEVQKRAMIESSEPGDKITVLVDGKNVTGVLEK